MSEKYSPSIEVPNYIRNHPLMRISPISQIIFNYLQYEDDVLFHSFFRSSVPERPCLELKNIPDAMSYSAPRDIEHLNLIKNILIGSLPWIFQPNIDIWYIPSFEEEDKIHLD